MGLEKCSGVWQVDESSELIVYVAESNIPLFQ